MTNVYTRVKIERLRSRQAAFTDGIIRATTWEISSLDYVSPDAGHSLHQLMMAITAKENPALSLFHSVDAHWQGNGHVVSFIPQFEAEARMILAGLLTYLTFYHPDKAEAIESYFTTAAVERSSESKWDPVRYCIITSDDEMVDDLLEVDTDFNFLDLSQCNTSNAAAPGSNQPVANKPIRPDASNLESRTLYGQDDDTVSTLATNNPGRKKVNFKRGTSISDAPTQKSSKTSTQDGQHSTVSSMSQTLEDRFEKIELMVNKKLDETSHLMRLLLAKQEALEHQQLPPNQDQPAGQPVVSPTGEASIPRDAGGGL